MTTEELKRRGIRRIVSYECSDGYKTTDPEDAERHEDSLWAQTLSEDMARIIREEVQKAFSKVDWSKIHWSVDTMDDLQKINSIAYAKTKEQDQPEDEVTRQVHDLIRERLEIPDSESIEDKDRIMVELGADSLDAIELIMDAEEKFGIQITDDESVNLSTVGEAISLIKKKLEENEGKY